MKKFIVPVLFMICIFSFSDEIEFTSGIYDKQVVTFTDGVTMYCYMYKLPVDTDFSKNVESLKGSIKYFPAKYDADTVFTIGDFSLFAMQYLKLNSGMFYLAARNGRYATRELMIRNIIPFNTSEYEKISGQELVTLIQKVVDYEEKK
jgi:hypothetical protein